MNTTVTPVDIVHSERNIYSIWKAVVTEHRPWRFASEREASCAKKI